jgi:hypothetical protein
MATTGTAPPAAAVTQTSQAWPLRARYYDLEQCVDVGDQGLRLGLWSAHSCESNATFDSWDLWVLL